MKPRQISIVILTSSLKAGGMERVASLLANMLSERPTIKLSMIALTDEDRFYELTDNVHYFSCAVDKQMPVIMKALHYVRSVRKYLKLISPDIVLSFGDRYNHISLLASIRQKHSKFVSNRQNPFLSNGRLVDFLNKMTYRWADGIVAQTELAKTAIQSKYGVTNVKVIPNPIEQVPHFNRKRENIILNVGRFGDSKNQFSLVKIFNDLKYMVNWKVQFYGDGPKKSKTQSTIDHFNLSNRVDIFPFNEYIGLVYQKASIFAFTSISEGFPNALAEAMAHGCACISFDCTAGPADIIDDGENGFLIPEGNHEMYKEKLKLLMEDKDLRENFGKAAMEKMKQFDAEKITQRFLDFMLEGPQSLTQSFKG